MELEKRLGNIEIISTFIQEVELLKTFDKNNCLKPDDVLKLAGKYSTYNYEVTYEVLYKILKKNKKIGINDCKRVKTNYPKMGEELCKTTKQLYKNSLDLAVKDFEKFLKRFYVQTYEIEKEMAKAA